MGKNKKDEREKMEETLEEAGASGEVNGSEFEGLRSKEEKVERLSDNEEEVERLNDEKDEVERLPDKEAEVERLRGDLQELQGT